MNNIKKNQIGTALPKILVHTPFFFKDKEESITTYVKEK